MRVLVLLAQRTEWVLISEIDARAERRGEGDSAFVPALVARGLVLHRVGAKGGQDLNRRLALSSPAPAREHLSALARAAAMT